METQNRCLDFLLDPSFQGVNRLFVSSSEDKNDREVTSDVFPNQRNKKLQCYDSWAKRFPWTNKK